MGRKNRNGRSRGVRTYTSFEELKNPKPKFNLQNGVFATKTSAGGKSKSDVEVNISLLDKNEKKYLAISMREDITSRVRNHCGDNITAGIVSDGSLERLYIIGSDDGFMITENKDHCHRAYCRVAIVQNSPSYLKYVGGHKIQFDYDNDEFFIVADV